jgi:hypothetical protein
LKSDIHSLRADVAADMIALRRDMEKANKEIRDQIVGLRRAVIEYHSSVVGHGILIGEPDARLRKVEQHLALS